MGGQAGIFFFDRRPIPPGLGDELGRSVESRGTDGGGQFVDAGLAIGYRAFHISKEDRLEHQPYVSRTGRVLTWDGRLDNRDDLLLQFRNCLHGETTDVAVAMACLEQWGEAGLARLIGDWSLALWDPAQRALLLASDYMGVRPLYYHVDRERLVWSSCLETILRVAHCEDDFEPRYIAGFLVAGAPPNVTPYRNVVAVPAGHYIRATGDRPGHVESRESSSLRIETIRYREDASYEAHLRQVFREVVRSRLRVDGTAWAQLSGGWDSSAVVCMAHEIIKSGQAQARDLRTVSLVSHASPEADESRFIEVVEQHCGIEGHHLDIDDEIAVPVASWVRPQEVQSWTVRMADFLKRERGRLLLSGRLGDATMGSFRNFSGALADYLAAGQLRRYLQQGRAWSLATQEPFISTVSKSLVPLLPALRREKRKQSELLKKASAKSQQQQLSLANTYSLSTALATTLDDVYPTFAATTPGIWPPSKRELVRIFDQVRSMRRFVDAEASAGVEMTHPYVDRRLVEFVLSIPTDAWCRPGEPRSLMRRAFAGFLPDRIVKRFSKGHAQPALLRFVRQSTRDWGHRIQSLEVVKRGYVSAEGLSARLRMGDSGAAPIGNLLAIVQLETWLEARASRARGSWPYGVARVPATPLATTA
jgi:asparagine synthase (glutamine-hydrolysing)